MTTWTHPVGFDWIITQTAAQHEERRIELGIKPGWYNIGLDFGITGAQGRPCMASRAGTVKKAWLDPYTQKDPNTGYGNVVYIDHGDGYVSIYAHLQDYTVKVGDKVAAGQVIGHIGSTGNSSGAHLHFEVRLNDKPIDPYPLLYQGEPTVAKPAIPPLTENLRATVTINSLSVRSGPGKANKFIRYVTLNSVYQVFEIKDLGQEIWVRISQLPEWFALYYQGDSYARFSNVTPTSDLVARLDAAVLAAKNANAPTVTIDTGDLQDLLQMYREKK